MLLEARQLLDRAQHQILRVSRVSGAAVGALLLAAAQQRDALLALFVWTIPFIRYIEIAIRMEGTDAWIGELMRSLK